MRVFIFTDDLTAETAHSTVVLCGGVLYKLCAVLPLLQLWGECQPAPCLYVIFTPENCERHLDTRQI